MWMLTISEMIRMLEARPEMWIPDGRYASLVAFIEGYAAGAQSVDLVEFTAWLSTELGDGHSPFHWSVMVAGTQNEKVGHEGLVALSVEESRRASSLLLTLLAQFLAEREG